MHYLAFREVYALVKFLKMLPHFSGDSLYGELLKTELYESRFASPSFIREPLFLFTTNKLVS